MFGKVSDLGMGLHSHRMELVLSISPTNQRSADGVGVSTPYGAVSIRGSSLLSPRCRSCKVSEGFSNRDGALSSPGAGGIYKPGMGPYPRWVVLALPLQPNSDQPLGLGFPYHAGPCRPGRTGFHPRIVGVVEIRKDV